MLKAATAWAGRRLNANREAAGRLANVLEKLGWLAAAERIRRSAHRGRIAWVAVPSPTGDRRARGFAMYHRGGADQIVRDLRDQGWDGYERPMPSVFAATVRASSGLVLDIGANTGLYSLISVYVRDGPTTHAFEPFAPVAAMMRENLHLNARGDRVVLVEAAVGAAEGEAKLYVPPGDHGLVETSCSLNQRFKETHAVSLTVPVVTVDGYWAALGRPRVGVIKVDVESLEHEVLTGASEVLDAERPFVFYELLPQGRADVLEAIRTDRDFVDIRLLPDRALVGDRVRFDEAAWNHLMVPAERLDEAAALLGAAGLTWSPATGGAIGYFNHSKAGCLDLADSQLLDSPIMPLLSLTLNQDSFQPGQVMILTGALTAGQPSMTSIVRGMGNDQDSFDLYLVVQLPDGRICSLQKGGTVVPGIVPMFSGVTPFDITAELMRYTFGGGEPVGTYQWFGALTEPGTLTVVGGIASQSFVVRPVVVVPGASWRE